ncbi:lipoprotein signal peptidase [Kribbella flavida DSM 17836]|uniref:Lipoprotein signal peptidase n=1 Tax=Kribbella flavida (strain DSM 17836 / JCM 10339 / NBRC 14399) TaxID=479435 RepID=D2Q0H0_KRIFD|nr:signal peptidase II [Kribbella flavida]ADB31962.1 lipoprotein signal peptidase [Kribbella flavida DSM 17836]
MQRTRRTPLSDSQSSRPPGDAEDLTEPADSSSAGSPSSPAPAGDRSSERGDGSLDERTPEGAELADVVAADAAPPRHPRPRLIALFAIVGLLVLGLDQLTKVLALQHLTPGEPVNVIGSLLRFNLIRNPGAAFSLGSDFTPVISAIQITVALGVIWLSRRVGSAGWAVAFGLLFGGAVGNITDRIFREPSPFHGHVVDFLQTPNWAIFNVADMAVTSAAALLVIQTLRGIRLDGTKDVGSKPMDTDTSTTAEPKPGAE